MHPCVGHGAHRVKLKAIHSGLGPSWLKVDNGGHVEAGRGVIGKLHEFEFFRHGV